MGDPFSFKVGSMSKKHQLTKLNNLFLYTRSSQLSEYSSIHILFGI